MRMRGNDQEPAGSDKWGSASGRANVRAAGIKSGMKGRLAAFAVLLPLVFAPKPQNNPQAPNLPSAVASAQCGVFRIPPGVYQIDQPIIKPRCLLLRGDGMGTQIVFTGTGPAIIAGDLGSPTEYPTGGVQDLTIIGPGAASNTVGVWLGGDPGGAGLGPSGFGDSQTIENVRIESFGVGVEWGNNAWVDTIQRCDIFENGIGITVAAGAVNLGEDDRVSDSDIFDNAGPAVKSASAANIVFSGTSFDYNAGPAIAGTDLLCYGCHFEGAITPLIDDSHAGAIRIFGGGAFVNASSPVGLSPGLFLVGPASWETAIYGLYVWSNVQVGALISGDPSGPVSLVGIVGNGNGQIQQLTAADVGPVFNTENQGFAPEGAGTNLSVGSLSLDPSGLTPFGLTTGPGGMTISAGDSPVLEIGATGTVRGATALQISGSAQPLRTTDQTGDGRIVMSNGPDISRAALALPSIGGGRPISRMLLAQGFVQIPRLQGASCFEGSLAAPGAEPGDVAFASPAFTSGSLGSRLPLITWSATVDTESALAIIVCNPTGRPVLASDYFWSAWIVGAFSPAGARTLHPADRRGPRPLPGGTMHSVAWRQPTLESVLSNSEVGSCQESDNTKLIKRRRSPPAVGSPAQPVPATVPSRRRCSPPFVGKMN